VGWPSPPGGPCARPPPGMVYPKPSTAAPLVLYSPPLVPPRLPLRGSTPLFLRMRSSAPLSPALLCSPPSLLPFQIYSRCRPLPDRAEGGGMEQRTARRRRNRAEDSEEAAESTRRRRNRGSISLSIRRQGAALPLRRAWSAPTPNRRLSDA